MAKKLTKEESEKLLKTNVAFDPCTGAKMKNTVLVKARDEK